MGLLTATSQGYKDDGKWLVEAAQWRVHGKHHPMPLLLRAGNGGNWRAWHSLLNQTFTTRLGYFEAWVSIWLKIPIIKYKFRSTPNDQTGTAGDNLHYSRCNQEVVASDHFRIVHFCLFGLNWNHGNSRFEIQFWESTAGRTENVLARERSTVCLNGYTSKWPPQFCLLSYHPGLNFIRLRR